MVYIHVCVCVCVIGEGKFSFNNTNSSTSSVTTLLSLSDGKTSSNPHTNFATKRTIKCFWVEWERRCESVLHKLTEVYDWAWSTWLTLWWFVVVSLNDFISFCHCNHTRTLTFSSKLRGKQTTQRKHFPLC